ncbi:MAG: CheB methylesterase [Myxococcaceae bacterium]|nr:CheB methylesterase [Myxococcaceae bacterium]
MNRNLIVIGGSAGALEVLIALVADLPADLAAAVLVVVHVPPKSRSLLPQILQRRSRLPMQHARDGDALTPGQVLVAPPDHHLLVERDRVRLTRGPRENGSRPAIDPLFRTAARWAGPRAVGVVVSGSLDDGTAGMIALHARGGRSVVQSPDDALYPAMPQSVLDHVAVDHVVPVAMLAPVLVELTREPLENFPMSNEPTESTAPELEPPGAEANQDAVREALGDAPSGFTCPDCHGALWELQDGRMVRYRCRVGHGFSPEALLSLQDDSIEEAMWAAYRALEESAAMSDRLARRLRDRGLADAAGRCDERRAEALDRARVIRRVLDAEAGKSADLADLG